MNTIDCLQARVARRTGVACAVVLAIGASAGTAHADLLSMQHWNIGTWGWVWDHQWLAGDFDGNGQTDLADVYGFCDSNCDIVNGIDVFASCSSNNYNWNNPSATCPPGIPSANQAGYFVPQHWAYVPSFTADVGNFAPGCSGSVPLWCTQDQSNGNMWVAGDFNGDGLSDIAVLLVGTDVPASFSLTPFISTGSSFRVASSASQQGGFIGMNYSQLIAGDFDGDGTDEIAYVFDDGGNISVDLHRYNPGADAFNLGAERWITGQGPWGYPHFAPADVNGDGSTDIVNLFDDTTTSDRSLDAYLSCRIQRGALPSNCPGNTNTFALQHWATDQNRFPGVLGVTSAAANGWYAGPGLNVSMIPHAVWDDPKAGLGSLLVAYADGAGNIDIDAHLAQLGLNYSNPGSDGFFSVVRYSSGQGAYLTTETFLAGDFNGDGLGDVADPFQNSNGDINIDVHLNTCAGAVTSSGQCCAWPQQLCNGGCIPAGQSCSPPR